MVEVTGRGSLPSMKVVCHPAAGGEKEEATLDPTCTVGRVLLASFLITTTAAVGAGGVLGEAFSGLL